MPRILIAIAATVGVLLASATPALADHLQTQCIVSAHAAVKVENGYVLEVRLLTTDGKPVGDAAVRFYDVVELLGRREMLIGTATTDGRGTASLSYLPAQTGAHEIVVKFAGRDHYHATSGSLTLDAAVAAPRYAAEPSGLALFSTRVPYAVGAVVLIVWALIAFALFSTVRGVTTAAKDARKGDSA